MVIDEMDFFAEKSHDNGKYGKGLVAEVSLAADCSPEIMASSYLDDEDLLIQNMVGVVILGSGCAWPPGEETYKIKISKNGRRWTERAKEKKNL
jgi:hypothetical protein